MSPVNEEPIEAPEDPRFAKVQTTTRGLIGASDRMPVRVIALLVIVVICLTLSPTPANIIGTGATLLLALDIATHRR